MPRTCQKARLGPASSRELYLGLYVTVSEVNSPRPITSKKCQQPLPLVRLPSLQNTQEHLRNLVAHRLVLT